MIIYFKVKNKEKILLFLSALLMATSLLIISASSTNLLTTPSNPTAGLMGINAAYANDGVCTNMPNGSPAGIAVGDVYHICFLKSDGNVDCQGNNFYGQASDYNGGDAIGVATGRYHSCFLKSDGNVDCQGRNDYGMANDYFGGDAVGVSAGMRVTCLLKSNGNVNCVGNNDFGQVNDYLGGDAVGVAAGHSHTCFLKSDGDVDCQGYNPYGMANDYLGGDAVGVATGWNNSCFLKSDGSVDCQGWNGYGQSNDYLGNDVVGVAAGSDNICFLKSNGDVDCQGINNYGQSNDYFGGDAIGVAAGFDDTCFLKSDGNVDCQGRNRWGQSNDYFGGDAVCQLAVCGNGAVEGSETCDDGNTTPGDGCSNTCTVETGFNCPTPGSPCTAICGDSLVLGSETCDDGNTTAGDGCSNSCTIETGFSCPTPGSPCTAICGDSLVLGSETCDDGNTVSGDGCDNSCAIETGFSCPTPGSPCTAICGDGLILGSETCDDNNTISGDGCNNLCNVEDGYICLGEPSVCSAGRRQATQNILVTLNYSTPINQNSQLIQGLDLESSTEISALYFSSLNDPPVEIFGQEDLAVNDLIVLLKNLIAQINDLLIAHQIDPEPLYEAAPDMSGSEAYFIASEIGNYEFSVEAKHPEGSNSTGTFTVTVSVPKKTYQAAAQCDQYIEENEYWSRLYYIETSEEELNSILEDLQYQVKSSVPHECLILYKESEVPPPRIDPKEMDQDVDHYYEQMEELFKDLLEPEDEEIFETIMTEEIRMLIQKFYELFQSHEEELKEYYQQIIDEIYSVNYYDFPGFLRYGSYGFPGARMIEDIKYIFSGMIPNELLGSYLALTKTHATLATIRTYEDPEGLFHILIPEKDNISLVISPETISKSDLFELIDDILELPSLFGIKDPLSALGMAEGFDGMDGTIDRDDAFTLYYRLQQLNYFLKAEYDTFGFSPDDGQNSREKFRNKLLEKYVSIANIRKLLEARTNDVIAEYWNYWHQFLETNTEPFINIKEIIFDSQDPVEILNKLKELID